MLGIWPLLEIVLQLRVRLHEHLPCDPEPLLLDVHSNEMRSYIDTKNLHLTGHEHQLSRRKEQTIAMPIMDQLKYTMLKQKRQMPKPDSVDMAFWEKYNHHDYKQRHVDLGQEWG